MGPHMQALSWLEPHQELAPVCALTRSHRGAHQYMVSGVCWVSGADHMAEYAG